MAVDMSIKGSLGAVSTVNMVGKGVCVWGGGGAMVIKKNKKHTMWEIAFL